LRFTKLFEKLIAASMVILLFSTMSTSHLPDVEDSTVTTDMVSSPIRSAVVWSDDFEDENIDDWEIFGVNYTTFPLQLIPGNFSVSGGLLRNVGPEWDYAFHNSSVAYGTWIFDVDIQRPDDLDRFPVGFMSEYNIEKLLNDTGNNYIISFRIFDDDPDGDIRLARNDIDKGTTFLDSYYVEIIRGWWNVIVTREESGQFYVYLNGDLILDVVDTTHTTSDCFVFYGYANPAIDNITVSDTIDYDKAPPKWSHSITDKEITLGELFHYDINATDHAGIDQYWIDDTQNFTIDDQGVITNITELVIGTYDVTVWVNDTLGNTQTGTFTLTVNTDTTTTTTTTTTPSTTTSTTTTSPTITTTTSTDTTEPPPTLIPTELLIAGIAAPILVIVVLVIWKSRK
jgi:hypothetical protein